MSEKKEEIVVVEEKTEETAITEVKKEELKPEVPKPNSYVNLDAEKLKVQMKMATIYAQANMFPREYQGNVGNCMIAIDIADRMGVSPFVVAQNLDIIQGNPCWKSTAAIALINNCGRFEPIDYEITHNEDWTEFSGYAYAKEKATGKICKGTPVTSEMAKKMQWLSKNGSFWLKMPEQMLKYRSAVFFARVYCPEALMGLYTVDEQRDIKGEETTMKFKLEG